MADPVTWIGIAVAVIGTAISTYSAVESAQQQEEAAKEAAKLTRRQGADQLQYATQQQQIVLAEGQYQKETSRTEAERLREQDRKLLAQQKASWIARGLDPNVGSPLELAAETASFADADYRTLILQGEHANETAIANANLIGQGATSAYNSSQSSAASIRSSGQAAANAGYTTAAGSAVSGVARVSSAYDWRNTQRQNYLAGTGGDLGWRQELY